MLLRVEFPARLEDPAAVAVRGEGGWGGWGWMMVVVVVVVVRAERDTHHTSATRLQMFLKLEPLVIFLMTLLKPSYEKHQ